MRQATTERIIGYAAVLQRAVKLAVNLFTVFLAAMGLVLFTADVPITWQQAWEPGIFLWAMAIGVRFIFFGIPR